MNLSTAIEKNTEVLLRLERLLSDQLSEWTNTEGALQILGWTNPRKLQSLRRILVKENDWYQEGREFRYRKEAIRNIMRSSIFQNLFNLKAA